MIVHLLIFTLLDRLCLRGRRIFTPSYPGEKSCSSESRRVSLSSSAGKSLRNSIPLSDWFSGKRAYSESETVTSVHRESPMATKIFDSVLTKMFFAGD